MTYHLVNSVTILKRSKVERWVKPRTLQIFTSLEVLLDRIGGIKCFVMSLRVSSVPKLTL